MAVDTPAPVTRQSLDPSAPSAYRWLLSGIVQGVGFRPFVYRLAHHYGLRGWVRNCTGRVEVVATGPPDCLQAFARDLLARAPAIARPAIERTENLSELHCDDFRILASDSGEDSDIHVPPDYFVCADCLAELNDRADRRYRYPFINCTNCGPRFSIIEALPYDRSRTTMRKFEMCEACRAEYDDTANRRFHAQPNACPDCGPQVTLCDGNGEKIECTDPVLKTAELLLFSFT